MIDGVASVGFNEFSTGLNGDCMEYALGRAYSAARGIPFTVALVDQIVHDLQASGEASGSGATSIDDCIAWAHAHGCEVLAAHGYENPLQADWHAVLLAHAGINPIVLNVANGQALQDVNNPAAHDEPGLHMHGICVVDKTARGYVCDDGDEFLTGLKVYAYDQVQADGSHVGILAALPVGYLVLGMQRETSQPAPVSGSSYTVATGDTLWGIIHAHGLGISAAQLYSENAQVIEAAAHAHGLGDARGGSLIFAGTILSL